MKQITKDIIITYRLEARKRLFDMIMRWLRINGVNVQSRN